MSHTCGPNTVVQPFRLGDGVDRRHQAAALPVAEQGHGVPVPAEVGDVELKRKLMSLSHCQELGQLTDLAFDWLFTLVQPIRSQLGC